jgi:acetylornithine/succinyldiaminopimelate/putrescine aminotransferase
MKSSAMSAVWDPCWPWKWSRIGERKDPAPDQAKELAKFCVDRGLLILVCGNLSNVVRILMPLVITDDQLDKGLRDHGRRFEHPFQLGNNLL